MRKTIIPAASVLILSLALAAEAQTVKMHGMRWNPTWIHGHQELDAGGPNANDDWFMDTGEPIWWEDGTPRYRAIRVWTGRFDQFKTEGGIKTPVNPDGDPAAMTNYHMPRTAAATCGTPAPGMTATAPSAAEGANSKSSTSAGAASGARIGARTWARTRFWPRTP